MNECYFEALNVKVVNLNGPFAVSIDCECFEYYHNGDVVTVVGSGWDQPSLSAELTTTISHYPTQIHLQPVPLTPLICSKSPVCSNPCYSKSGLISSICVYYLYRPGTISCCEGAQSCLAEECILNLRQLLDNMVRQLMCHQQQIMPYTVCDFKICIWQKRACVTVRIPICQIFLVKL